jgi:hypothetical protein
MLYAVEIQSAPVNGYQDVEVISSSLSVEAQFDSYTAQKRVRELKDGETLALVNRFTGRTLRTFVPEPKVDLSGIKLTDAMRKALDTATSDGVSGAANTLKALATRGLVEADKGGYRLSSLGRQYRAQRKGA